MLFEKIQVTTEKLVFNDAVKELFEAKGYTNTNNNQWFKKDNEVYTTFTFDTYLFINCSISKLLDYDKLDDNVVTDIQIEEYKERIKEIKELLKELKEQVNE